MKLLIYFITIYYIILNLIIAYSQVSIPQDIIKEYSAISKEKIEAHLRFLSSDLLEGRGTGQRGGKLAAEYIATQFQIFGLKKPEKLNNYFQNFSMIGITTEKSSFLSINQKNLKMYDDYVMNNEYGEKDIKIEGNLLFVGYGIIAPEFNWNDYKNIDVKNKILLMMVNEPPSSDEKFFNGKSLTYYGRWTYKYETAARLGASAVILIHTDKTAGYNWNVVKNSWGREQFYLPLSPQEKRLKLAGWITNEITKQIFKEAKLDYDKIMKEINSRQFHPIELPIKIKAHLISKIRRVDVSNVIGYVPTKYKKYNNQPIFITAHYDHLGKEESIKGDNIYNGAVDNATGTSILLELARVISNSNYSFNRPIVFLALAAEEDGLRGSEFYIKNPLFPLEQTAVDINIDGASVWGETKDITILGADRSNLITVAEKIAKLMNFELVPEAHPEQGYFFRSDQFNFAKVGIPCMYIKSGIIIKNKPIDYGSAKEREYREKHYHQPSDEFNPNWDLEGLVQISKIALLSAYFISQMPNLPQWNPNDEFAKRRK